MARIVEIDGWPVDAGAVGRVVLDDKKIVLLKRAFSKTAALDLRRAVIAWGRAHPAAAGNDFRGNFHRRRVHMIKGAESPHVFHDYNFNNIAGLNGELSRQLLDVFANLCALYNDMTGAGLTLSAAPAGPFVQPQIIQYPAGGGFFARHSHPFEPQKIGFIVHLSEFATDYRKGGTVFEIDGETVDLEGIADIGDICVWRFDYPHWVTQSDLSDDFDWNAENGRWVATFPFNDPVARAST